MTKWLIKFRSGNGLAQAMVSAATKEAAEDRFQLHLYENNLFGVIINTSIMVHGGPAPTA